MKQIFSTEKLEKRLKFIRIISFLLILIGLFLLAFKDYKNFTNFASLGSFIDSLIFIVLGLLSFIAIKKQIKITSGYIKILDDNLSFKSRQKEKTLNKSQITNIKIGLKEILITSDDGNIFIIYLDDYLDFSDKKEIKSRIGAFNNKL
jgi:hypothetical protein